MTDTKEITFKLHSLGQYLLFNNNQKNSFDIAAVFFPTAISLVNLPKNIAETNYKKFYYQDKIFCMCF